MAEAKRALALFDFDGTLLKGDSIVSFVRFARKQGALSRGGHLSILAQTARYLLGGMTDAEIKTLSFRFLAGLSPQRRDQLARDFVRAELLPRVYPAGRKEIARQKAAGRITVLVSASTENYMRYAAEELGFDELLCTPLEADGSVQRNCKGEEKPRRIQAWLDEQQIDVDWDESWGFGDSKSDAPMLLLCGHPMLVNPKKELIARLPEAQIIHWE